MAGQSRTATKPATKAPAKNAAPAAPRSERPVPFRMGEVLTYDVSWSSYVTAGTATVTVREKRPSFGSTAYYIVAEGRPTPLLSKLYTLFYKAETLLDSYTLLPQRGVVYSEEGKDRRTKTTSFNQGAKHGGVRGADGHERAEGPQAAGLRAGRPVGDLRAARHPVEAGRLDHDAGDRQRHALQGAGDGRQPRARAGRRRDDERVEASSPTVLDDKGKPNGRAMAMWISDDERKLPLKLQADLAVGSFMLTLREVR